MSKSSKRFWRRKIKGIKQIQGEIDQTFKSVDDTLKDAKVVRKLLRENEHRLNKLIGMFSKNKKQNVKGVI